MRLAQGGERCSSPARWRLPRGAGCAHSHHSPSPTSSACARLRLRPSRGAGCPRRAGRAERRCGPRRWRAGPASNGVFRAGRSVLSHSLEKYPWWTCRLSNAKPTRPRSSLGKRSGGGTVSAWTCVIARALRVGSRSLLVRTLCNPRLLTRGVLTTSESVIFRHQRSSTSLRSCVQLCLQTLHAVL